MSPAERFSREERPVSGVFGPENARGLPPSRPSNMNKTDRGRILVAGGSENYPGAPIMSARAALRSGSGIVSLLSLPKVCLACASCLPEAVQLPAERPSWQEIALNELPRTNAAVVGPGLGRSPEAIAFAAELWKKWDKHKPLLMDADALYALAVSPGDLPPRQNAVLTPHEGEAARLLATTPEEIRRNRAEAAERLSRRWGCVLLKGEGTLVAAVAATENGGRSATVKLVRLSQGGPELSVQGSGDVLSGCIGAFLAQGLEPFEAACLGGTLHGMAGARLRRRVGVDGILASEIADELPFVLRSLRERDEMGEITPQ
jgi:NAD(P)H-hydrate epimerase